MCIRLWFRSPSLPRVSTTRTDKGESVWRFAPTTGCCPSELSTMTRPHDPDWAGGDPTKWSSSANPAVQASGHDPIWMSKTGPAQETSPSHLQMVSHLRTRGTEDPATPIEAGHKGDSRADLDCRNSTGFWKDASCCRGKERLWIKCFLTLHWDWYSLHMQHRPTNRMQHPFGPLKPDKLQYEGRLYPHQGHTKTLISAVKHSL